MDGVKTTVNTSLRARLSLWVLSIIILTALIGSAFSFYSAFEQANELQDTQLWQISSLFSEHASLTDFPEKDAASNSNKKTSIDVEDDYKILIEIITQDGIRVLDSEHDPLQLPYTIKDGIHSMTIKDEQWRVLVTTMDQQQRLIVAQEIEARDDVARESATATIIPYLILIPILLFIVNVLIHRGFKPVSRLASELDRRDDNDLTAIIPAELPSEILPFTAAINRMLARVNTSILQQQRFIADAAHEIRTPLTALNLQLESLESSSTPEQSALRLSVLKNGLQRTRALVNQLLALARAQQELQTKTTYVSIQHVFRKALEDLIPLAESKHIDIGITTETDANVVADEHDLMSMIKNLIDNAIRYTPEHGKIDLSVSAASDKIIVRVEDSGPGIPDADIQRVFDPFYRVLGGDETGSGLGLSIVQTIATRVGAKVELENRPSRSGLRACIIFPAG